MSRVELPMVERPNGVLIYRGPSRINGKRILVVVTSMRRGSTNPKTGGLVPVYILPDMNPVTAVFGGKDKAVCGDCPHRYVDGAGSCYVNPVQGPLEVWKGVERGIYPTTTPSQAGDLLARRLVRLGAYGDPAAVPMSVWNALLAKAAGWTGYTHQWRRAYAQPLRAYCMASVETLDQRVAALKKGWRTFRVRASTSDELGPGEFECPAGVEQGKRLTCAECMACSGGSPPHASPAIVVHGPEWKVARYKKLHRAMTRHQTVRGVEWSAIPTPI